MALFHIFFVEGPIIVNENVSEIDENIKILKAKLEKQRQTTLKLYEHKATTYFIEEKEEQRRSSKTITKNDVNFMFILLL